MPSCNKFFSHTAKLPHRTDLRGKSLSSCSRSCRAASRRMGRCRPKAVKGCMASLAQKRAVEKGGEHRGGTKQTFHAPRTTATTVCRLAARPGPFCRARRAVRARRTAVGLPVVVCCCHLRHCGPKQLAAFCPGPSSALFPKWRQAGALARGIAARCGPRAMPGKGCVGFLAMSQRSYGRRAAGDGPGCVSRLHQCFSPVAGMLPGALSRRGQPASGNVAAGLRGSTTGLAALAWGKAASGWLQAAKAAWGQKLTWNI